jgi:hypothetical protein
MAFDFSSVATNVIEPRTTEQYKPTGAPTKYSMAFDVGHWTQLPNLATSGMTQGVISVALKATSVAFLNFHSVITVQSVGDQAIYIRLEVGGGLSLYVDNVFKATSAISYDFTEWRFVALHFDMGANPWKAKVIVDGVEAIAEATDPEAADAVGHVRLTGPVNSDRAWYNGQIIVQDAYADTSPPRYVTRISTATDVSTVGTWSPTSGTNHASTGIDPFSSATNTEEAAPAPGDDVITGFGGDLTSLLGGIPGSVDLVTVHSYSTGLANTARAEVGDQAGAVTTAGTTELIGADTTYAYASAPVAPGDSLAWEGTDTPKCKYEVVSV